MADRFDALVGAWAPPAYGSVALRRVRVFYGRQPVLTELSLRFEAGTATALMGANGAGKSTILNVLSTLLPMDAGDVVAGDALSYRGHRDVLRPTIGLVAHEPMLYGDLSARENLQLWADLYGLDHAPIDAWLQAMDLADTGARAVSGFSRGMKQRLAVTRAMLHAPTLVLFDEVLTGLDLASRENIWALLAALRRAGRITVLATHVFEHPPTSVCRGVVLSNGRIRVDAPASEGLLALYSRGRGATARTKGAEDAGCR